jgi:DNA-binding transcriptional LysR family regulator
MRFTLHELACLDAVITEGGFQPAAEALNRTRSAVIAAVAKLERGVGVALLDRSGYRVTPTQVGRAFRHQAREVLAQARALDQSARLAAQGEETDLRIVIGDVTPAAPVLRLLKRFFAARPATRLHLHFEALAGPAERLLAREADLIIHHIDKADPRLEWLDLLRVAIVPVATPGLVGPVASGGPTPRQMGQHMQVVIRDSAAQPGSDYFLQPGVRQCTVADQHTKRELIVQGMGWGHMPLHMVDKELRSGRLVSIEGRHFKRLRLDIVAARLREPGAGPVAQALWLSLGEALAR